MGRRPEVFVRSLSMPEGQRLQRITRTAKDPVKLRRAIVVLMSAQGQPAADIAYLLKATDDYVRDVIHAFNDRGFDAPDPKWSGGTPNKISEQTRKAAQQATFEYIEGWYNTRRRHSSLGYQSPAAYEGGTVISLLPTLKVA